MAGVQTRGGRLVTLDGRLNPVGMSPFVTRRERLAQREGENAEGVFVQGQTPNCRFSDWALFEFTHSGLHIQ